MTAQIRQLTAADFDEAMDMMNYAFSKDSPTDFPHLLPKLYQATDEHMSWIYAGFLDGGMRAAVGLIPLTWHVDDVELRVAGVGGVCTHPRYRQRGLYQQLMGHCVEVARAEGYHLSWLGGQRQRYAYFGYEKCGVAVRFRLNRKNVAHAFSAPSGIGFEAIQESHGDRLGIVRKLHDAQALRAFRSEPLYDHLTGWNARPHAALDGDEMIGYLLAGFGPTVIEIVGRDDDATQEITRAWVEQNGDMAIVLGPLAGRMLSMLDDICEGASVEHSGNWQVFDWVGVIEALLRARLSRSSLVDGEVVLSIEGCGAIEIAVSGGEAHCRKTDRAPSLHCDALQAHRLLFGPLPPSQVMELPAGGHLLEAWCPLPLYWPDLDHV